MRSKVIAFLCSVVLLSLAAVPGLFAQDLKMKTVGELASANLYLTYVSISAVADSHSRAIYKDQFAMSLIDSITGLAKNTTGSLRKVLDSEDLDEQDTRYLTEMIATLETLIEQAESYNRYIVTKSEQYVTIYNSYKQISWKKVAELLGLERKKPDD